MEQRYYCLLQVEKQINSRRALKIFHNVHSRIVHHPKSFWAAKTECQEFKGQLLRLRHTKEVMEAIGDSMVGNAEDFRIDGWSDGVW